MKYLLLLLLLLFSFHVKYDLLSCCWFVFFIFSIQFQNVADTHTKNRNVRCFNLMPQLICMHYIFSVMKFMLHVIFPLFNIMPCIYDLIDALWLLGIIYATMLWTVKLNIYALKTELILHRHWKYFTCNFTYKSH